MGGGAESALRVNKSEYRGKIESASLDVLSPDAIQAWRIRFIAKAGRNPALQRTARISCNSLIRQARALFSKKLLKFIKGIEHPASLPFADCEMFPRESMRYISKIDPSTLLQCAQDNLAESDPDAFLALLLAIGAGLRRGEIDNLLWRQVDFKSAAIHIEATEAGALKSEDSAGSVPLDDAFLGILRGYMAKASSPYVIGTSDRETESREWGQSYRIKSVFNRLNAWLRANGVDAPKPLHTLRKEAGSQIATQSGIYAASRFLRHADIQVTAQHYADHKDRVTVGIAGFLKPENVTQIPQAQHSSAPLTPKPRALL